MTYKELYDRALWDLEHCRITLGEFEDMIEPLNKEIPEESEEEMSIDDFYNKINEFNRQMLEEKERTLAEIITKYDFMVGSMELKEKLTDILPKGANIAYSPFIENNTTIFAIKKFDIKDLLTAESDEENLTLEEWTYHEYPRESGKEI